MLNQSTQHLSIGLSLITPIKGDEAPEFRNSNFKYRKRQVQWLVSCLAVFSEVVRIGAASKHCIFSRRLGIFLLCLKKMKLSVWSNINSLKLNDLCHFHQQQIPSGGGFQCKMCCRFYYNTEAVAAHSGVHRDDSVCPCDRQASLLVSPLLKPTGI